MPKLLGKSNLKLNHGFLVASFFEMHIMPESSVADNSSYRQAKNLEKKVNLAGEMNMFTDNNDQGH